jgi:hypothetical protein
MFDTTREDLKDLLRKVHEGRLQLPEFQRDYVWGDEDVKSLIASVAKGFPVGALLTLETGGELSFKPRLLAGVPAQHAHPAELLLDGQQRMTSLYQAAFAKEPVRTRTLRGTEVDRYYYIDINRAVSVPTELEDAIVGVPANRVIRTNFGRDVVLDLSTAEAEYELDHFPLNQVFDSLNWYFGWRNYWSARGRDVGHIHEQFVRGVLKRIEDYKMPLIRLDKSNTREAICLVFERVNVGGKKLDAFELVTALYAAEQFDLREDWSGAHGKSAKQGRHARMLGSPYPRDVLAEVANTDFLQSCTLLHTRKVRLARAAEGFKNKELPQVSCNRASLLALPLNAYREHADSVEEGFRQAAAFLNEQKIIWHRDVPYPPQIVGLASVFAILGREATTAAAKEKLAQWFWSVTLGELYGSSTESRLARDVPELVEWIPGTGPRPRSVDEALFQRDRLNLLRTRISAAYKGMHALLMRHGCRDFISGRPADLMTFFNDHIDIHHVFPQKWCKDNRIESKVFDSIINKTPLSRMSNQSIGGSAPSVYLKRIQEKQGLSETQLDNILRSHLIEPEYLRADDFEGFFAARRAALVALVAEAMGKAVVEESGTNEVETEIVEDPETMLQLEVLAEAV